MTVSRLRWHLEDTGLVAFLMLFVMAGSIGVAGYLNRSVNRSAQASASSSIAAPVQPTVRECLALAAFTEARSEGAAGMAAVLDVIRNRQRDGSYPADACAVVRQRNQFIGVAGWTAARAERIDASSWSAALVLSSLALDGVALVPHACRGATHFDHAQSTRGLVPLCRIGVHTFYRERN